MSLSTEEIVRNLNRFNAKERFHLFRTLVGSDSHEVGETFRRELKKCIGVFVPKTAVYFLDYHLDWLVGALSGLSADQVHEPVLRRGKWCVEGNQRDIDLLLAFHAKRSTHLVFLEAKCAGSWDNAQLRKKLNRLTKLFGADGDELEGVIPHFVLASPHESRRMELADWPRWAKDGEVM